MIEMMNNKCLKLPKLYTKLKKSILDGDNYAGKFQALDGLAPLSAFKQL